MKITQFLLDKIVAPLLIVLLTPTLIGIGSKIKTGDWIEWFGFIPNTLWIAFALFILLWIIVIAIRRRFKQLQRLDTSPGIFVISNPAFGRIPIGKLNYAGVVWSSVEDSRTCTGSVGILYSFEDFSIED